MASSIDTVQYICDQAALGGRLSFKKMFGEYALYLDGKIVALVCDDQLFLKPTPAGQEYLGSVREAPPYAGAKSYFLLEAELDDPERLNKALQITGQALPEPKPKSKPKPKPKNTKAKSVQKPKAKKQKAPR
jgi:TfoX/Sxy family transcriptional regulator of competence genes